jgi:glutathione S-transferase
MRVTLHGVPGSPYTRAPLLACEEKGVPWRLQALGLGQSKSPEHLERHPFGRLPVFEDGDFRLYETQAILRYVDAAYDGPPLTPADPKAMARMSQVMNIVDSYVMPSLSSGIAWNRMVAPLFGMPVDEEAVKAAIPQGRTCIAVLEDLLGEKPYFGGAAPSLADLMAYPHIDFAPHSPEGSELIAGSPLLGWLERMAERPSAKATTWEALKAHVAEPA